MSLSPRQFRSGFFLLYLWQEGIRSERWCTTVWSLPLSFQVAGQGLGCAWLGQEEERKIERVVDAGPWILLRRFAGRFRGGDGPGEDEDGRDF